MTKERGSSVARFACILLVFISYLLDMVFWNIYLFLGYPGNLDDLKNHHLDFRGAAYMIAKVFLYIF